ncbi:MAG: glutamate-5-semialdehyde dehydrogenase [Clostridiales bacterium]|jgi:glutamate-5-semialdehyde dehydrogenase|nr:glutamate-5-semialdehyde dehydrogenase [Clostridiales bacterium]
MDYLNRIGMKAKTASKELAQLSGAQKNEILALAAEALLSNTDSILNENGIDYKNAQEAGVKASFLDRLKLSAERIEDMANGLTSLTLLGDPVGDAEKFKTLDNGLMVGKQRVPLGVVALIYEARPNVTSDAFGICFKTGNAVILRGGKEAFHSNLAIVSVFRSVLKNCGYDENMIQMVEDTSRETAEALMKLNKYIDVLIPRGGAALINSVKENSSVPVIETGVGNCHIYVDDSASFDMAREIIVNAKTQRPGVCNALEKVLIHKDIAEEFLPIICDALKEKGVQLRGDFEAKSICPDMVTATEEDWFTEYLDLIIAIKIVNDIGEAIEHIGTYSSGHSEAIITNNYANSRRFLAEVDSAAVYVNASTRFTDGAQFGLGAEIGISTQKLHARGPMGLEEMTSVKYIIYGSGQVRP